MEEYVVPQIEVVEIEVEQGFAGSNNYLAPDDQDSNLNRHNW